VLNMRRASDIIARRRRSTGVARILLTYAAPLARGLREGTSTLVSLLTLLSF